MEERLQKILSNAGVASRRAAEELIRAGRVAVDGVAVTELGHKFNPANHTITVDGKPIHSDEKRFYQRLGMTEGERRFSTFFQIFRHGFILWGVWMLIRRGCCSSQMMGPLHRASFTRALRSIRSTMQRLRVL